MTQKIDWGKQFREIWIFLTDPFERLISGSVSIFFGTIVLIFKEQPFIENVLPKLPFEGILLQIIIFLLTTFISFIITRMSLNILITIPKFYKKIINMDEKFTKTYKNDNDTKEEIESFKGKLNNTLDAIDGKFNQLDDRIKKVEKNIQTELTKIKDCPKMVALHTDDNVLEAKLELIEKSENHKWLLSRLLSKMIAGNCNDFSFYISISDFTKFISDLATMETKEFKIYTPISVFTWLNSFTDKDDPTNVKKNKFYNNLEQEFPLDKTLLGKHFISLINSNEISTKRYVFLSQFEWDNKYLSERYLDAYYKINKIDEKENKCNIYFIKNDNCDWNEYRKTFDKEYVIYDDIILLSYQSDKCQLSYISDKKKSDNIKQILNKYTKDEYCLKYDQLKEKIIEQKISMLNKIIGNSENVQNTTDNKHNATPKISHTLSFLFRGNEFWQDYQRKEKGFNDYSRRALNDGLISFIEGKQEFFYEGAGGYKIVEIGPGDGSKTKLILNTLGTETIREYHLIDVNETFLDITEKILEDSKKKDHNFKHKIHMLDICDNKKRTGYRYNDDGVEKRISDIFHNSVVIIATNSSLFYENGFNLDIFSGCKAILLTIQTFSKKEKDLKLIKEKYNKHQRLNLLIHPLRAFNIPICEDTIANDYLEVYYQNDKLKINFKLKNYLSDLIQNEIEMNVKKSEDLSCYTEKYQKDYKSYVTLLNKFTSSEEITIYETLKFEDKCNGITICDKCKQPCNIRNFHYFKEFKMKIGFTKDPKRISKYVFILLTK
jgi:hypothetical protein